jgi:peptidoglycan/xylan/chitin deacetylase (PgdA/CDA1 family)
MSTRSSLSPPATAIAAQPLLQRKCAYGNQASRLGADCEECQRSWSQDIPAGLAVGASNDPLEQEADRAAAQVLGGAGKASVQTSSPPHLSRVAHGAGATSVAPASVARTLRSSGESLPGASRAFFEPRFGHDFAQVRIHRDSAAADSARDVAAHAYAVGQHVVFARGRYAPDSVAGRALLAHELAHVVQQSGSGVGGGRVQRTGDGSDDASTSTTPPPETLQEPAQRVPPTPTPRVVALTFDDGPHAAGLGTGNNRTEKVLDTLRDKGAKAGFFVQTHALSDEGRPHRGNTRVGRQLIRRMHAEGHAIGIHTGGTVDHESHIAAQAAGRLRGELSGARDFIRDTTATETEAGVETTLVRPPFGRSNEAVRDTYAALSLTNLLWDIDGDPGGELSLAQLKTNVETGLTAMAARSWRGSTPSAPKIVMLYHDIRRSSSQNLGAVMDHITLVMRRDHNSTVSFEKP